jgi:hypothetical protein
LATETWRLFLAVFEVGGDKQDKQTEVPNEAKAIMQAMKAGNFQDRFVAFNVDATEVTMFILQKNEQKEVIEISKKVYHVYEGGVGAVGAMLSSLMHDVVCVFYDIVMMYDKQVEKIKKTRGMGKTNEVKWGDTKNKAVVAKDGCFFLQKGNWFGNALDKLVPADERGVGGTPSKMSRGSADTTMET